jgi:hypothetical protein
MMISQEQARLAAEDIRDQRFRTAAEHHGISLEVLLAARSVVENTPDTRPERVQDAMNRMDSGATDSHAVAQMMVSRIISDSLR